jgi:3-oxoacyl-[acyl-carrier-protein] synthase II
MSDAARDHLGRPRVAVTGIGVKAPAGNDLASFWSTVRAGKSMGRTIEQFDPTDPELPVRFACEVRDFDPVEYFGPKEVRRQDRVTHFGFAAASDAIKDAGDLGADPSRCAVIAATGVGGLTTLQENVTTFLDKGPSRVSPFFVPMMMPNATAGAISIHFGFTGPALCISTACAAGANGIGEAARMVRDSSADVVVAGGTEAFTSVTIAAFARMGALSGRNDDPELASRPFDADRDGFVIAEGAAFLVLESLERARARGAKVYGEVSGYGRNADAFHITAPSPGGVGAATCMQQAIDDAGLNISDIGHVNAHGTSTPMNDSTEAEAIRKVFGDDGPPVTGSKGVLGHMIGAAGAVEAVIALCSITDGVVPPTANTTQVGDDIGLDLVIGTERDIGSKPVISNSFGFGGHNASLVLTPTA